jgi:hypothetical protein
MPAGLAVQRRNAVKQTPEQRDGLERRLNDGGCPVLSDHGYKISPMGLAIEKIPGMSFNSIFELAHGGTGYAIEVVLRNEANRPIDIQGFQIRTPWGIPKMSLLPAPRKSSAKYPHYSFPEPGRYFDGAWVLNRIFARRKSRLNPGEELEGVLVTSSEEIIPVEIPHLARIIATLIIFDSRRNAFPAQFKLPVIRGQFVARKHSDVVRTPSEAEDARRRRGASPHPLVAPPAPAPESLKEQEEFMLSFFKEVERINLKHKHATKPIELEERSHARPKSGVGSGAGRIRE